MAKITRIKAKDSTEKTSDSPSAVKKTKLTSSSSTEKSVTPKSTTVKKVKNEKNSKKPFILIRPFIALGIYLRESWQELRQVRWPSRKATWKLFFAVIIYTAIFMIFITLLDLFFSWLFNLILNR